MFFKKFHGKIFDVELNSKEQKVLDQKLNQRFIELHKEFMDDFDYMILWVLHNHFNFDQEMLRNAYNLFIRDNEALIKHYEMDDAGIFIARKEMNAIGCNLEEWKKGGK